MSEKNKDNNKFEFIKEQIRPRKRKRFRKWLVPFLMTIIMAILFGLVAAITFCISEPKLYKLLHKDQTNPFVLPSPTSKPDNDEDNNIEEDIDDDQDDLDPDNIVPTPIWPEEGPNGQVGSNSSDDQGQVIMEPADIDDFLSVYENIKELSDEVGKSILTVSSIINGKDWFGNPIEKRVYTTGIVVENDGSKLMILVGLDRVKDASSIRLEINETISVEGILQDYETELNLAIITVKVSDIPAKFLGEISVARIGESYTVAVGSPIIALGSPNGYPSSIDMGIITSKGSRISITDSELDLFNTNMTFNKESDGVIINYRGEVIGIITRTLSKDLNKELGTVLGISKVRSYINRMVEQKPRIYCGIVAENLTDAASIEHNVSKGIYVYEVKTDSPAYNGGLMSGDIILNVGNRTIANMNTFYSAISQYEPGTEVIFKIKRTSSTSDNEMEVKVILEEKKQ